MNIFQRSDSLLSLSNFKKADQTVLSFAHDMVVPDEQYILRMMVKSPDTDGFVIPDELDWAHDTLIYLNDLQKKMFVSHPYVYITVRSGEVKSVTDDEWHVDGFSMRVPHLPEQNYIWSNCYPTEVLNQQFIVPQDFDPLKHNLHTYFQNKADSSKIQLLKEGNLCIIDPYVVHRRPQVPVGIKRSFVRISFIPVEIEVDSCTPNPLLTKKFYNRKDIRESLVAYS